MEHRKRILGLRGTHRAYNAHNRARNSSAVSPCNRIGLSSHSPSGDAVRLESDRDESVSDDKENMVSNADLSFVNVDRCTYTLQIMRSNLLKARMNAPRQKEDKW